MRALISRQFTVRTRLDMHPTLTPASTPSLPAMRTRRPATSTALGLRRQRADYYFDASHQTAKTFRVLLSRQSPTADPLGLQAAPRLLAEATESFLYSIRPYLNDDAENRTYFLSLLRLHLSRLHVAEIDQLIASLRSAQFTCYISDSIIDDVMKLEYGFTNGPPHCQTRTLLQANEFFDLLDVLRHQAVPPREAMIKIEQVTAARLALAHCASSWAQSTQPALSPEVFSEAAQVLAMAFDMPAPWHSAVAGLPASGAAMLDRHAGQLRIDPSIMTPLPPESSGKLFTTALRDLMELLLTHKLFGIEPADITQQQRFALQDVLDQIAETPPPVYPVSLQKRAAALMTHKEHFGQIHIMPTLGVALGHAWVSPVLSLLPDKTKVATDIGTLFLHAGFQLNADNHIMREWPSRFLSEEENENLYPMHSAWHLTVPADQQRLQEEAGKLRQEWRDHGIPYRFMRVAPAMEATGCRVTVWQAVQRAMDEDAQALFAHYNRGLPEPDSPTELWQRFDGLMRWITQLSLLK